MESIIGIKIPVDTALTKCVSIVREYEITSIAEIKKRVVNNDYLIKCGYTDRHDLKRLLGCCDALEKLGIKVSCYEHGRSCSRQFLKNLNGMYDEISDRIDAEIETEAD